MALGGAAVAITAGELHTCALMANSTVRCWGNGSQGKLGYGSLNSVGDGPGEMPPPEVAAGGLVKYVEAGKDATCALLDTHILKCWGTGVGDQPGEMPPPSVKIGGNVVKPVARIGMGGFHKCAVLFDDSLHCWGGANSFGQLGYGHDQPVSAMAAGPVPY